MLGGNEEFSSKNKSALDLIAEYYQENPEAFTPTTQSAGNRSRLLNDKTRKPLDITGLGPAGREFAERGADQLFKEQNPIFSLPITEEKIAALSSIYDEFNKDLTGDLNGSSEQVAQAEKWQDFWEQVKTERQLDDEDILPLQEDFLQSYRYQILLKIKISGMPEDGPLEITKAWRENWRPNMSYLVPINGRYRETKPLENAFQRAETDPTSVYARVFDYFRPMGTESDFALFLKEKSSQDLEAELEKTKLFKFFGEDGVKKIINEEIRIDGVGTMTPLNFAILQKNETLYNFLIKHGAKIEEPNPFDAMKDQREEKVEGKGKEKVVDKGKGKEKAVDKERQKEEMEVRPRDSLSEQNNKAGVEFALREKNQDEFIELIRNGADISHFSTNSYERSFFTRVIDSLKGFPTKMLENWRTPPEKGIEEILAIYGWELPEREEKLSSDIVSRATSLKDSFDEGKQQNEKAENSGLYQPLWQNGPAYQEKRQSSELGLDPEQPDMSAEKSSSKKRSTH